MTQASTLPSIALVPSQQPPVDANQTWLSPPDDR